MTPVCDDAAGQHPLHWLASTLPLDTGHLDTWTLS
eukprot:CAMPEP_0168435656 /NCGR_PEP_ID=MMETSP0228-20121227/40526_1 /TAXON_ID=133427 /ORGANISM="Protoceratium reticulatum, Strain CCCM 535 (=CCMP 1889)" /LENGTH=34 /DNA_ID= /DNA_START= /DNA_END= /DNA_ORIENTATION=